MHSKNTLLCSGITRAQTHLCFVHRMRTSVELKGLVEKFCKDEENGKIVVFFSYKECPTSEMAGYNHTHCQNISYVSSDSEDHKYVWFEDAISFEPAAAEYFW